MKHCERQSIVNSVAWIVIAALAFAAGGAKAQAEEKPAYIVISLPADARLEIEGVATKSSGDTRRFQSPSLVVGKKYVYTVKAVWTHDGKEVVVERPVTVQAGQEAVVDLRPTTTKKDPGPALKPTEPQPKVERPKPEAASNQLGQILAPDVGTPPELIDAVLELAGVGKSDVVYDLGCGDGRIVIAAAKKFGAKGVGVDIDKALVQKAEAAARQVAVEGRTSFRVEDALAVADLGDATVVTLYLLPASNLLLRPILQKQLKPGARIVSLDFDMGDWKPAKTKSVTDSEGVAHTLYLWQIESK